MGQEEPLLSVVSNQADKLAVELAPLLDGQGLVRYVSTAELVTITLSPHEILIVDFRSVGAEVDNDLCMSLLNCHPVLGLFSVEEIDASTSRLQACTEAVAWPADHNNELEAKLKRLCRLVSSGCRLEQSLTLKLNLVGESGPFQNVITDIKKFSKCDAPVLMLGETGTGKEKIARAIHYLGVDDTKPFIAVNCGALPDNLVENELFGHVKGAYTDARQSQRGLVEQAEGGTLFLDEIEALSHKGQVALLRFLQDYEYRPLGSQQSKKAHLRLITASNEPLERLVSDGYFRKDLFYRINILSLDLPPLRERVGDVVLLAEHFVDSYRVLYQQYDKYIDPETLAWMVRYDWPGNVRELENLILREFLLADSSCITIQPLVGTVGERRKNPLDRRFRHLFNRNFQDAKSVVVREFERSYLQNVLKDAKGNISQAARQAGKERRTFAKLLEKHGIHKEPFSPE